MAAEPQIPRAPQVSWSGLGLPPLAGRVLEYLVGHPETAPGEAAAALGTSTAAAARALRLLESALLAVRLSGREARWSASPPRPALGSLLARRREELASLETYAERLHEVHISVTNHRFASDQFEILDTEERITARYAHLLRAARHEVLHLVMPPYVAAVDGVPDRLEVQAAAIRAGVRFRSVYDSDTLSDEVSLETARRGVEIGGDVRLSSGLPMKLVLFDGSTAIMPLRRDDPAAGSLLVHSPTLIHVLAALFESLWEHGVRWGPEAHPDPPQPAADLPHPRAREVLRLLSLGMKQETIARTLGVSRRTVQKDVSDIGMALGARNRFQIALLARERGWLAPGR
ncbi:regulatory protein, luxR family [Actinacidiphila yanglinensis]|uniref:Regulatory protein, luxR family n=1 Tax=Actinacidiphila yanglinensis TaxID=310779 RepID=A0A1H6E104_9ACTN|nr:LuxR C-terminal-related transcriptional regulator [Actinacidiphila yanglinensis]SEG91298.1 regulatory protein, luxR family [Actinacidiphila yanglinensis]